MHCHQTSKKRPSRGRVRGPQRSFGATGHAWTNKLARKMCNVAFFKPGPTYNQLYGCQLDDITSGRSHELVRMRVFVLVLGFVLLGANR